MDDEATGGGDGDEAAKEAPDPFADVDGSWQTVLVRHQSAGGGTALVKALDSAAACDETVLDGMEAHSTPLRCLDLPRLAEAYPDLADHVKEAPMLYQYTLKQLLNCLRLFSFTTWPAAPAPARPSSASSRPASAGAAPEGRQRRRQRQRQTAAPEAAAEAAPEAAARRRQRARRAVRAGSRREGTAPSRLCAHDSCLNCVACGRASSIELCEVLGGVRVVWADAYALERRDLSDTRVSGDKPTGSLPAVSAFPLWLCSVSRATLRLQLGSASWRNERTRVRARREPERLRRRGYRDEQRQIVSRARCRGHLASTWLSCALRLRARARAPAPARHATHDRSTFLQNRVYTYHTCHIEIPQIQLRAPPVHTHRSLFISGETGTTLRARESPGHRA